MVPRGQFPLTPASEEEPHYDFESQRRVGHWVILVALHGCIQQDSGMLAISSYIPRRSRLPFRMTPPKYLSTFSVQRLGPPDNTVTCPGTEGIGLTVESSERPAIRVYKHSSAKYIDVV